MRTSSSALDADASVVVSRTARLSIARRIHPYNIVHSMRDAIVASPDAVRSPVSGSIGAFVHLEVGERRDGEFRSLGSIVVGDLLRLEIDGRALELVVRRALVEFTGIR